MCGGYHNGFHRSGFGSKQTGKRIFKGRTFFRLYTQGDGGVKIHFRMGFTVLQLTGRFYNFKRVAKPSASNVG